MNPTQTCKLCGFKRRAASNFMSYWVMDVGDPDHNCYYLIGQHDLDPPGNPIEDRNDQELRETLLDLQRKLK